MKSDKSRDTFHPEKHFSSVRLQQGRVLTDADWNEQSDVIEHRDETTSLDVIGQAGVPRATNGFQIDPFTDSDPLFPVNFRINGGRMYVDGILCELDQEFVNYTTQDDKFFDPALASTLAPSLPIPGDLSLLPLPELSPSGMVLVYADVWMRHIGVVEDPAIRETALGGPDTATRAKTVVQIKVMNLPDANPPLSNVDELIAGLSAGPQGRMEAQVEHPTDENLPCIIPESAGFTRLENQLYRVEVHTAGEFVLENDVLVAVDGIFPTFKWSRDNGSVLGEWLADPQPEVGTLKVRLPTRDESRGFAAGQWVELTDDTRELSGVGGIFVKLIAPTDLTTLSYDPNTIQDPLGVVLPNGLPVRVPDEFHPKVRRWDMPSTATGPQQLNPFAGFVDLESGVQVRFPMEPGKYRVGDYWLIPARTINNTIEFAEGPQFPLGIRHHFACLASFQVTSFGTTLVDCRRLFDPLTDLHTGTVDQPTPGQFRYYLIDASTDNNPGGDANGKVGIDDNADAALGKAVPFLTLGKALSLFPRDGNGSHAIFLLKTSGLSYGDFLVDGVHGYRKIVIRGSSFENINTVEEIRHSGASTDFLQCAVQDGNPPANMIKIDRAVVLPGPPEAPQAGQRVRFPDDSPTASLRGFTSMVLGVETTVNHAITITDLLNERPSSSDFVLVERPGPMVNRMQLGVQSTAFMIGDDAWPSVSVVGLNLNRLECHGGMFGEIAFCQVGGVVLGQFDQFSINGVFHTETGGSLEMGMGVNVLTSLDVRHGSFAEFRNSAAPGGQVTAVDDFQIDAGFFQALTLDQCDKFRIGAGRGSSDPYRLRLGVELEGTAIRLNDSSGEIFGASLETPVPVTSFGNEANFIFTNGRPNISLAGTNRSLRLDDVQTFIPVAGATPHSGVILDASGAVACTVQYDPTFVANGLFVLPQTSEFRPFELSQTDVFDAANNHYLSPRVSFTHKGTPWKSNGAPFERYSVTRFVPNTEFRVEKTNAFGNMTADQLAGVAQQEYLPNTDGTSMHVITGYSLVRLHSSVPDTITAPTVVLLTDDTDFGTVRLATASSTAPQIQIGVLVRVIIYQDNHPNASAFRFGLVRLDIRQLPDLPSD